MTLRVVITAEAKANLRSAYEWAAQYAPETAARWLDRFEAALKRLDRHPRRRPLAPEDKLVEPEIRELIFGRRRGAYRALFTIIGDEVRVLHVRRAAREFATPSDLGEGED